MFQLGFVIASLFRNLSLNVSPPRTGIAVRTSFVMKSPVLIEPRFERNLIGVIIDSRTQIFEPILPVSRELILEKFDGYLRCVFHLIPRTSCAASARPFQYI